MTDNKKLKHNFLLNPKQSTRQHQEQEQAYYTELKETMEEDDLYKEKSESPEKYEMNVQKLPEISELGFWLSNLGKWLGEKGMIEILASKNDLWKHSL